MSANKDEFLPNVPHTGQIGTVDVPWAEGHFDILRVNGALLAGLASPEFTGTPTAPTAAPGTNTTQLATAAYALTAANAVKDRATHTGTQLAASISDFTAAVAATPTGVASHAKNADTVLAASTANEVTALALRSHLDDATLHGVIDDSTEAVDADRFEKLFSAGKVLAILDALSEEEANPVTIGGVIGAGALASLDQVGSDEVEDGAIGYAQLSGGGETAPTALHVYGTNAVGTLGFQALSEVIPLASSLEVGAGQGTLVMTDDGLAVVHGTAATNTAAGNDTRFPTAQEKLALTGAEGSPAGDNRYLTEQWVTARSLTSGAINTGTAAAAGPVSAATLATVLSSRLTSADVGDGSKVDGDVIDIDRAAAFYTPTITGVPEADDIADLAAHLAGIDNALGDLQTGLETFEEETETALTGKLALSALYDNSLVHADNIDVNFAPVAYSPSMTDETTDTGRLAAHLKGIDSVLGAGAVPDADGDKLAISWTPPVGTYVPDTSITEADTAEHLSAHLSAIAARYLTPEKAEDSDFLNANHLEVTWEPAHYTPTSVGVAEAEDNNDLAAHLAGIDNQFQELAPGTQKTMCFTVVPPDMTWDEAFYETVLWPTDTTESLAITVFRPPRDIVIKSVYAAIAWRNVGELGYLRIVVDGNGGGTSLSFNNPDINEAVHARDNVLAAGERLHVTLNTVGGSDFSSLPTGLQIWVDFIEAVDDGE